MIKLEARIKLFDSNDGTVNNAQFNNNNNISWNIFTANSSFGQIVGKEVKQSRPFLLGHSPLVGGEDYEIAKNSDMYVLADRVNYFIGSLVSGDDGTFPNGASYTITINGVDFNAITIVFDKDEEVWPTEVVINGKSYINDDAIFTVSGLGGTVDQLEVTISKLNKPNKGLIVTGIYVDITIVVNEKNLDSFTYSLYDRENNDEPSYGVVSNSGTLSFVDSTGEVLDYITSDSISEDLNVSLYIKNTSTNKEELFVKCYSNNWTYDNDNFVVEITLKDVAERMQKNFISVPFTARMTGKQIYEILKTAAENIIKIRPFDELDVTTKRTLSAYTFINFYIDNCSLWEAYNMLCESIYATAYTYIVEGQLVLTVKVIK